MRPQARPCRSPKILESLLFGTQEVLIKSFQKSDNSENVNRSLFLSSMFCDFWVVSQGQEGPRDSRHLSGCTLLRRMRFTQ